MNISSFYTYSPDSIVSSLFSRPRYAIVHLLAYANVLITGADRADETLYASISFLCISRFARNAVSHFYDIGVDVSYSDDMFVVKPQYIHVSSFTSHGTNSLEDMVTHEQLIRVRFALIYYGALSHGRGVAHKPMVHVEDIGIPVVGRLDKINTAVKRNAIKM